jgi:ribonucleoside-diphosphate reductase alpha chain
MYLPISHPDVPEILRAKDHANGDSRQKIDSNIALTITDEWIESMIAGNKEKQELFGEVLKTRMISGSPYLIFIDNANNQNPACYVERGLTVKTSNLCSEVFLHTDENHSFVCVLSSLNLSKYDEFKDWRSPVSGRSVPQIAVHLLESVVSEFIRKAKDKVGMGRSVRFAEKSRALGLGVMGLHTLYQKRGLPFKSQEARELNTQVHKWILQEAETASRELAVKLGEPEWCVGSGKRHTHLLAVAPTKTNSVICGAGSEGIEPIASNYFVAKQAKGSYVRKNPILESLLCKKGVGPEVWDEILEARGSVQGLACLTDKEKEVFKTAREVDQFELVKQAADRQPFICQGQSLNLFVDPEADADYIMRLHLSAWKMGLKSLYYLKSSSLLTKKKKAPALIVTKEGCPWCDSLKQELYRCGITYKEMDKQEAIDKGYWNHDWKTVPQLWLYDKHIGGYTEYMQYKEENSVLKFNLPTETTPEYTDCTACEA